MFKFNVEKIKIGEEEINSVSLRELHKFVGATEKFNSWAKRHLRLFVSEKHFTRVNTFTLVNRGAKREIKDYIVTLDTAKHIALMSKTDKGMEVREYFINLEKDYQRLQEENLKLVKENLRLANKKLDNFKGKFDDYYSVYAVYHLTGKYYSPEKLLRYCFDNKLAIKKEYLKESDEYRNLYHKDVWLEVYNLEV